MRSSSLQNLKSNIFNISPISSNNMTKSNNKFLENLYWCYNRIGLKCRSYVLLKLHNIGPIHAASRMLAIIQGNDTIARMFVQEMKDVMCSMWMGTVLHNTVCVSKIL